MERVMHILNRHKKAVNGSKILVLGIAYKQDISDYRESPAVCVMKGLCDAGADVEYYDPWVPEIRGMYGIYRKGMQMITPDIISGFDLIVITAAHTDINYGMIQKHAKFIFDTKNVMKEIEERSNIEVL